MASYSITFGAGSFALTFAAVGLRVPDGMFFDTGSFALTFNPVSAKRSLVFGAGSFAMTFADITLKPTNLHTSFALTFGAVTLTPTITVKTASKVLYSCTLSGSPDYALPISSFQARYRSSDPTYLSVVVPNITTHIDAINARSSGTLTVTRTTYNAAGAQLQSDEVISVTLENIRFDTGTRRSSGTLDGHKTSTFVPKVVQLEGASYYNVSNGLKRYRCTPNNALRPGDTVQVNDVEFEIDLITWHVSPSAETMEVREAIA